MGFPEADANSDPEAAGADVDAHPCGPSPAAAGCSPGGGTPPEGPTLLLAFRMPRPAGGKESLKECWVAGALCGHCQASCACPASNREGMAVIVQ